MASSDSTKPLFHRLSELMELDGEYLSHGTALFLLGLTDRLPDKITSVSPRRRRNRVIGNHQLVFIYHPQEKQKHIQTVSLGDVLLQVSSPEKSLVDLMTDMDYAPPIIESAKYFSIFPIKIDILLQIAHQVSDTVFKRISFLLAWSGRASFSEIPFAALKRTPIKLDPRISEKARRPGAFRVHPLGSPPEGVSTPSVGDISENPRHPGAFRVSTPSVGDMEKKDLIWDGRFFLKYPSELLNEPPQKGPANLDPAIVDWIEFRRYPAFIEAMATRKYFPIRGDESKTNQKWIYDLFSGFFKQLPKNKIENLLLGHIDNHVDSVLPNFYPKLFNRWIDSNFKILESRKDEIIEWIKNNLHSPSNDRLEVALHYGNLLGFHDPVIESLAKNGYRLFNAGRFRLLNSLSKFYLESGKKLPHYIFVIAARSLARLDRFDEAIEVLDRGKKEFEDRENAELESGELAYTTGNIFRLMNKVNEAMSELFLAREFYISAKDRQHLAAADCALGNLYFAMGSCKEARSHYLSALSVMRELGIKDSQASLLGNLGLVEYESGRLKKAILFISRGIAIHKMLKNTWNEALAGLSLAKVLLLMGYFLRAMKVLQDCYKHKLQQKHDSGIYETAALLGWTYDLLGKSAAAKAWWDIVPQPDTLSNEPRALFVVRSLKAMTALFHCDFKEAEKLYAILLDYSKKKESSNMEIGDSYHGIGICQTFLDDPNAPTTLAKAQRHLGRNPLRIQLCHVNFFSALFFPDHFPDLDLGSLLMRYVDCQAFDPFWGLYAQKLQATGISESAVFIEYHLKKTAPTMLQSILKKVNGLNIVIKNIKAKIIREDESFTFISESATHPLTIKDYRNWRETTAKRCFIFDGPGGIISNQSNIAYLKPESFPHGILTQLFIAHPHSVDIDALYKSVWGSEFDQECDIGAFKSSLQRLKKVLSSVSPAIRIRRRKTLSPFGGIGLSILTHWEVVI